MASAQTRRTARRRARRARDQRHDAAWARFYERMAQWRATEEPGEVNEFGFRPGGPRMSRRDLAATSWPSPSRKQAHKHLSKKVAKLDARRELLRTQQETQLTPLVAATGLTLTRLNHLGGFCPMTADGMVSTGRGDVLTFSFRFRYDRAFLEVGAEDPEYPGLVKDAALVASRDDVTGHPYEGDLEPAAAVKLLGELFAALHAPAAGERFGERFTNTIDLVLDRGGDPTLPTLIR